MDNVQTTYTYDEAKKLVAKALEPMGDEYFSTLKAGMESGWIDVYENGTREAVRIHGALTALIRMCF